MTIYISAGPKRKVCARCGSHKQISEYHVSSQSKDGRRNICKICANAALNLWISQNKERCKNYAKQWRNKNAEKCREATRKWKANNPGKAALSNKLTKLKRKEKATAQYKIWRSRNLDRLRIKQAKRRSQNKLATPSWADHYLINDMYKEAEYQQLHVDHIVPLKSALVCGLHWEGNLQLLTSMENRKKGNRTWPDM